MRILFDLEQLSETIPLWAQLLIAILLVSYSVVSVYGRVNTVFGSKAFSRVPESQLRSNRTHIVKYTVIPVIVTLGYLYLLSKQYF
jgi:hypothetical protein